MVLYQPFGSMEWTTESDFFDIHSSSNTRVPRAWDARGARVRAWALQFLRGQHNSNQNLPDMKDGRTTGANRCVNEWWLWSKGVQSSSQSSLPTSIKEMDPSEMSKMLPEEYRDEFLQFMSKVAGSKDSASSASLTAVEPTGTLLRSIYNMLCLFVDSVHEVLGWVL